ncbi:hypothetical protein [Phytohabitans houttuyneae]|uniref:Uncharacterized protein n=1 Tax=Phytohabitans houttuyneae TaxID=1076126 RepID=A0A6V8KQG3_9ACTN|nr:hypothetical protein [Phytohabitans houttuyneae]GFJ82845.1 hypothetical protein Phou_070250 [Phytohabitans houttuyneae]
MRTPWVAPALAALLGMAGWGVVEMTPDGREPPPAPVPVSVPALAPADELRLERAAYRDRLADQARAVQRARAEAEAKRVAAEKAAAEPAQPRNQAPADEESPNCYPAGCVPPPDPDLPAAPDNGGEPAGPYCYTSPTGRVCTTY